MTMGESGMAGMGEMGMPAPPNSIPMLGAPENMATSIWAECSLS
jgi:hypothetical protein